MLSGLLSLTSMPTSSNDIVSGMVKKDDGLDDSEFTSRSVVVV